MAATADPDRLAMTASATPSGLPPALIVTSWYGGSDNGVALVAESLAQSLERAAAPVAVLHLVGDGWWPQVRTGTAGETILSICLRDPAAGGVLRRAVARLRLAVARRAIRRVARHLGLRIAHFHYAFAEYGLVLPIVAELGMTPVATFHGSDLAVNMGDPPTRAATERLLRSCGAATAVSDALRTRLVEAFPFVAARAVTVHNAVPQALVDLVAATAPAPRDIDVLFVGNLIHRKGVDVLLQAFASLRADRPSARLVIAGDGEERVALERLTADLALGDAVSFVGRQSREQLVALYARARVLAVPSRAEPFGLVVVEGMVSGAAVVASRVGGIPEIVTDGETGVLVAAEDPAALAAAIATPLGDEAARARLADAGRRHALASFSPEAVLAAYADVYRAALARTVRNADDAEPRTRSVGSRAVPAT